MEDFRVRVGWRRNPKIVKLQRRLGADSLLALLGLWEFATVSKPDGDFFGMDDEAVEIASGWAGEPGAFICAAVSVGLIDKSPAGLSIHDWEEHNPWVAGSSERSRLARTAALLKHHGLGHHKNNPATGCPSCGTLRPAESSLRPAGNSSAESCGGSAPFLSDSFPTPSPSSSIPSPKPTSPSGSAPDLVLIPDVIPPPKRPPDGTEEVWARYAEYHPKAKLGDKERRAIKARLKEGSTAADLCQAIDGYHRSPFHCGENDRGAKYLDATLIFRDASHVAKGIEMATATGALPVSDLTRKNIASANAWLAMHEEKDAANG